ncbi:MAG: HAD family hydrolase [Sedimentisphaerales bacterium]|nr:HAD family hydrolase [Sedimentisphaerales bacterium]
MITTVIFDLDDTLYNEIDYCMSGLRAVAAYLHKTNQNIPAEQIYRALWNQFQKGNRTEIFNAALEELYIDYDEQFIKELVQVYRNHKPDIKLPEESLQILEKLKSLYTLALLSDGFLPAQKLKVQVLGIEKYFKKIIYTEQFGRQFWKPSTKGFEKLIKELNIKAQQAVYVSDNPAKDFIAPNKLGIVSIQLKNTLGVHKNTPQIPEARPKHIINRLNELEDLLQKL